MPKNDEEQIILDYIVDNVALTGYGEDGDEFAIPSYVRVDDIVTEFNVDEDEIVEVAKEHGFLIFDNKADIAEGLYIAHPDFDIETFKDDFKNYYDVEADIELVFQPKVEDETDVKEIEAEIEDEDESLEEDTVKQGSHWVNKGKEGTHGKFKTKKAADAQRKAMFARGYKEDLDDGFDYVYWCVSDGVNPRRSVLFTDEDEAIEFAKANSKLYKFVDKFSTNASPVTVWKREEEVKEEFLNKSEDDLIIRLKLQSDKTEDELALIDYLKGEGSWEDYLLVCDTEECEPEDKEFVDSFKERVDELEESLNESKKSEVITWWKDVEAWDDDGKYNIDNEDYSDVDGMHAAMFDMLKSLKDEESEEAKKLFKKGKTIYNKYAVSQFNEDLDEDKIDALIDAELDKALDGELKEAFLTEGKLKNILKRLVKVAIAGFMGGLIGGPALGGATALGDLVKQLTGDVIDWYRAKTKKKNSDIAKAEKEIARLAGEQGDEVVDNLRKAWEENLRQMLDAEPELAMAEGMTPIHESVEVEWCVMDRDGNNIDCFIDKEEATKYCKEAEDAYSVVEVHYNKDGEELYFETIFEKDFSEHLVEAKEIKPDVPESFDEKMDFLAADEQEAIDGYELVIAALGEDEANVKEQLEKIKIEEIAHKEFLEKVKLDHNLVYTEPLEPEAETIEESYEIGDEWGWQDGGFVVIEDKKEDKYQIRTSGGEKEWVSEEELKDRISTGRKVINGRYPFPDIDSLFEDKYNLLKENINRLK